MPASQVPPGPSASDEVSHLRLCQHCDLLGVSSVVRSDTESTDVIHCSLCNLSFHFVTEGNRLIVTQVRRYQEEK
jgi:transcription elongation factor Elf1